jgi:Integrase zinc binding domain/RNase H-like domain found in reverse transcriptase
MLEALMKWEDKLLGRKFTLVTNHKGLKYFETQKNLSDRQVRWWEFLSRFNFTIMHVDGVNNKVADCLSRYYENNTGDEDHPEHIDVNADARLDPDGKLLPTDRYMELKTAATRRSSRLPEKKEARIIESEEMNDSAQRVLPEDTPPLKDDDDILVTAASSDGTTLRTKLEDSMDLPKILHNMYHKDAMFSTIMAHPDAHKKFGIRDGLIWTKNQLRRDIVCVPRNVFHGGKRMIEIIINHTHQTVGHYIQLKTSNYIRRAYWWPKMATDIELFCTSCARCQMNKTSTQWPKGLLHSLPIPDRPWQSIGIDFMGPLPKSNDCNYLMVIIDRLTSHVHLVPTTTMVTAKGIAWLFIKEIVRLHGFPDSIVSDRDSKFTSIFWRELQRLMATKLLMATAFHPQTDGATKRAN